MAEIQSVSIRHEAIMDYLMANPTVPMGIVAKQFRVSPGWLSQIVHSDAFQDLLREKQGIAFHHTVLPLREKMTAVAHIALDKLVEQLPNETETKTISQVADSVLDRLGFSSKPGALPPGTNVNVQVNVLRQEIAEAQKLLGQVQAPRLEVMVNGERAPIALPRESAAGVGETFEAALLRECSEAEESAREAGHSL